MPGPNKNFGTVGIGEADITNETFVRFTRGSSATGNTAGTYINAFDGTSTDNRNEVNASAQFVPDKTGEYDISAIVRLGSVADGDRLDIQVYDDTNSVTIGPRLFSEVGGNDINSVWYFHTLNLTAGDKYEIRMKDNDSSFDVEASDTEAIIKRSVVQP